jgi:hypothetical protein
MRSPVSSNKIAIQAHKETSRNKRFIKGEKGAWKLQLLFSVNDELTENQTSDQLTGNQTS